MVAHHYELLWSDHYLITTFDTSKGGQFSKALRTTKVLPISKWICSVINIIEDVVNVQKYLE